MKRYYFSLMLLISFTSFDSISSECGKIAGMKLDDFAFEFAKGQLKVSPLKYEKSQGAEVKVTKVSFGKQDLEGNILLRDKEQTICSEIPFRVNLIKLCKDADGNYESWRFVTCPDSPHCWKEAARGLDEYDSISIVSLDSVTQQAKMSNAKICGTTKITSSEGKVFIRDSYLGPEVEGI